MLSNRGAAIVDLNTGTSNVGGPSQRGLVPVRLMGWHGWHRKHGSGSVVPTALRSLIATVMMSRRTKPKNACTCRKFLDHRREPRVNAQPDGGDVATIGLNNNRNRMTSDAEGSPSATIIAIGSVRTERRRTALAFIALVVGAIAMGASPIFVRLADVGPYASAFWRTCLALPFLWIWAHLSERRVAGSPGAGPGQRHTSEPVARPALRRGRDIVDPGVILAGLFFAGDLFFWHLSILATTVANATFLATTSPIWVALGAWYVSSEAIGARFLGGLALCIAGGAALIGESYGFLPQRLVGDLFGLITAVFFGGYILAIRHNRARFAAARLTLLSTAITALCLFVIATAFEPRLLPGSIGGFAAVMALALISQVGGQGLLTVALGTLPAAFSSLVIFLEAVAAAAFGWLILGEPLGIVQMLGGVLILAGIFIARPATDPKATQPGGP